LLGINIPEEFRDIVLSHNQKVLLEAQDCNRETALFHAVRANRINNLKMILQYNPNPYHRNKQQKTAADIAYEMQAWGCLWLLLQHGFLFPDAFNENDIHESECEFVKFIEHNNEISKLIAHGKTVRIAELVALGGIIDCFRNIKNQSAITIAFRNKNFENYVFLKTNGFREAWHEAPIDINLLSSLDRVFLKNAMASSFVKSSCLPR